MTMPIGNSKVFSQPFDYGQVFGWWNVNRSIITKDGSNNVSAISDLSGNSNTFTATGTGNLVYPVYTLNAFNERAGLQFTHSSNTGMTAGNVSPFNSAGFTIFTFSQSSADPTINQMTISKHTASGSFYVGANNLSDGVNKRHFMCSNNSGPTRVDVIGNSAGGNFCWTIARYNTASGMTLFRNENIIATGSLTGQVNNAGDPLMLGTYNGGGNFHLEGYIGEAFIILGALSDSAIRDLLANYGRPYWGYTAA